MAKAGKKHKPSKAASSNKQAIDDVYFRRWRNLFGSERARQHLEDLLRSRPSWHVSASGEVTRADPFWPRATLSEEINAEGVDCLAVHYTAPVHGPDYSQYNGRFFLRTVDIIEYEEHWSGNNVDSDYSPTEQFEREIEGRPRTSPRLYPTAPIPAPKKKRRKAKQPSRAGRPPAPPSTAPAPAVSEPSNSDADGRPTAINPSTVRKRRQSIKETRVIKVLRELDGEGRLPRDRL
jgi:hypothetical protein